MLFVDTACVMPSFQTNAGCAAPRLFNTMQTIHPDVFAPSCGLWKHVDFVICSLTAMSARGGACIVPRLSITTKSLAAFILLSSELTRDQLVQQFSIIAGKILRASYTPVSIAQFNGVVEFTSTCELLSSGVSSLLRVVAFFC